jgi:hypothetical protein
MQSATSDPHCHVFNMAPVLRTSNWQVESACCSPLQHLTANCNSSFASTLVRSPPLTMLPAGPAACRTVQQLAVLHAKLPTRRAATCGCGAATQMAAAAASTRSAGSRSSRSCGSHTLQAVEVRLAGAAHHTSRRLERTSLTLQLEAADALDTRGCYCSFSAVALQSSQ